MFVDSNIMIRHVTEVILIVALLNHHYYVVKGQQNQVSPKLDFDGTDGNNSNSKNLTIPSLPDGVHQRGRVDGRVHDTERRNRNNDDENTNNEDGDDDDVSNKNSRGNINKTGPKIHGVRVTVDTGDTDKSKKSKESVEITDVGKNKKRVGIHTDITFEITTDGDGDGNNTSSAQKEDKEDASVPIFKGRDRSHKPNDHKNRWNPNFSTERRSYDGRGSNRPTYPNNYYPTYRPYNVPVYVNDDSYNHHSSSNTGSGGDTSLYYRGSGWSSYMPNSQWTTERSYYENYQPNKVIGSRGTGWKPCYCIYSQTDYRRRRSSSSGTTIASKSIDKKAQTTNTFKPKSAVIHVIDGKLETPYERK